MHEGLGPVQGADAPLIADLDIRLQDVQDAEFQLQTTLVNNPATIAVAHFDHGRLAAETGDPRRAAMEMEAFGAAFTDPVVASNFAGHQAVAATRVMS